jgi:ABC-type uncharacterized transport system ATPase subunit
MIRTAGISKSFGDLRVLKNINLEIRGERLFPLWGQAALGRQLSFR